jgi:hypothetical protein
MLLLRARLVSVECREFLIICAVKRQRIFPSHTRPLIRTISNSNMMFVQNLANMATRRDLRYGTVVLAEATQREHYGGDETERDDENSHRYGEDNENATRKIRRRRVRAWIRPTTYQ